MERKGLKDFSYKGIIAILILLILTAQFTVSIIHRSRYYIDEDNRDNDYCCVQMSRDAEEYFEGLGIDVKVIVGYKYNYDNITNYSVRLRQKTIRGLLPEIDSSHMWIVLDFGWIQIPYESTWAFPFEPITRGYEDLAISEGFFIDGKQVAYEEEDMEWRDWNR